MKKVSIKIRTAEGQQGSLNVFVIEKLPLASREQPMCAMLEIPLKPLNLHERISALTPNEMEELPLSRIVLGGRFSQSDGLQWVANIIPNVPNVIGDGQSSTLTYFFRSSFTKTVLVVQIEEESITVQSDNFSVITIIKD